MPVETPSSCDTGHNAQLAMKGSVQQSLVNRPVNSEHVPVTPGPGSGLMTGTRGSVPPTKPGKPGATTTPGSPVTPGDSVTPGDPVRPVYTGQKAQKEKTDQCLDQSELPVLNSPDRLVQLEHNVHKQPGNMPILPAEHWSEHSEVFHDFMNSDSPMSRHMSLPNALNCNILDIGLRASVTPATLRASVTLVTVQTKSMGQAEPGITLMSPVLHGEIVTHIVILFLSVTLT